MTEEVSYLKIPTIDFQQLFAFVFLKKKSCGISFQRSEHMTVL